MNNSKPILHISIYYQYCSKIKKELRKKLSAYSKRLVEDICNPLVDIRIDTLDTQEEKKVLMELSYHKTRKKSKFLWNYHITVY
jgi:hypothetical protein